MCIAATSTIYLHVEHNISAKLAKASESGKERTKLESADFYKEFQSKFKL